MLHISSEFNCEAAAAAAAAKPPAAATLSNSSVRGPSDRQILSSRSSVSCVLYKDQEFSVSWDLNSVSIVRIKSETNL